MTRAIFLMLCLFAGTADAVTDTFTASGIWTAPAGVTSVDVEVWGGGGAGGGNPTNVDGGGGGGGGGYSRTTGIVVVPGTPYTVTVGAGGIAVLGAAGGNGGDSWFSTAGTILAKGGAGGAPPVAGAGGLGGTGGAAAAGIGTTRFSGGNGGTGRNSNTGLGAPGGSSSGSAANGTSGPDPWSTVIQCAAQAAPAGGGIGGDGGCVNSQSGFAPASGNGGGGGGGAEQNTAGGNGAVGLVSITYTLPASVLSINCAAACTTNATSVSWAVTFSEPVTGLTSGNFTLVNGGLGGPPAITSVTEASGTGSNTIWTVTAGTGTGTGTLGLDMVNTTGVTPAMTNLPFNGQVHTLDRAAPTVASITRVDPTPTALASVSWTVTFSEPVSGVDATDFVPAQAGGVSGALVTGVTPVSGTVYTVTASTGTSNGTLGLDLADNDSIIDVAGNPLGGAGAGNGDFSGELYDIVRPVTVTASPTACTNVAGIGTQPWGTLTGPLASDNAYATASVDGTITNFLQCVNYGFAIPAGVTINGITVNVERKSSSTANGGSQDAAMRVVKAGVIGATDKSTATTYTTADVVEAHGGAADLWGTTWSPADINAANFGAAFAATKANTAGAAHTISVDHMSISVDYTLQPLPVTVLSIVLASPDPTSPATSVDWTVTFSDSVTGVDPTDFALVMGGGVAGAAITGVAGSGTTWTVTASTGTGAGTLGLNLVDDDTIVDATLAPLGGTGAGNGDFTGQVYTVEYTASGFVFTDSACVHNIAFSAPGQTCAQVSWSTPPQVAGQDLTGAYITAVNTSGVPTRLHTSQDRTRDMQFGLSCHDPVANAGIQATFAGVTLPLCQTNGATPVVWSAVVTVTFPGGSPSSSVSYTFNYADVGLVALWARNNATPSETGTSGAFVVKPAGFVLSNIIRTSDSFANPASVNATGTKFVKAGETFSVTVTATTAGGGATPNYGQENTAESVKLTPTLVVGLGLTNNPEVSGTFGTFSSGVATGTTFTWNEAGIVTLTPSVADADYLGTGDVTGTASGNVGRFYAAQFTLSGGVIANRTGLAGCAAPAGCGTFTYMGEEMSAVFSLIAKAADGTTTLQNYNYSATAANNFAKFDPIATGNPLVLAAVDTGTPRTVATLDTTTYGVASGNFSGGIATVTAPFAVIRGGSPSGPFDALDVGINPVDSDGATLAVLDLAVNVGGAPDTHGKISSTKARYGRIKISNAHGSELLNLPVSVVAQYWNGTTYITNTLDDDSTFAATDVALNNYQKNLASGETSVVTPPALVVFTAGIAGYKLAAPGSGNNGSVDMTVNVLSAYLSSNTARATFGVYKGNNEFIYLRENY